MNRRRTAIDLIEEWLSEGPNSAPDRLFSALNTDIARTPQSRIVMNRNLRIGLAAAAAVVIGAVLYGALGRQPAADIGTEPSAADVGTEPSQGMFEATDTFVFSDDGDLWLSALDGSGARAVTSGEEDDVMPAWSPDGMSIAFLRDGRLSVLNADGSLEEVTEAVPDMRFPRWAPDGARILAMTGNDIAVIDVQSGESVVHPTELGFADGADWSPDGFTFAFTGVTSIGPGSGIGKIFFMDADGGNVREVFGFDVESGSLKWSPDGAHIAFQSDENLGCIYLMSSDGTDVRQLTSGCSEGFTLTWSPEASRIAWAGGAHGPNSAFVVEVETGEITPIPELGRISDLDWRPTSP